jgi:cytochrome c oxidase assembly protein subunit 15
MDLHPNLGVSPQYRPRIQRWLLAVMALVVVMVALGGFTRLTESGLSIVEWNLVSGTLPPLSHEAWEKEFAAYQTSPQFKQVNSDFSVSDFQKIFWLEYLHRLLGRIIGLATVLPFFYFAVRKQLSLRMFRRGLALSVLVAAQGAVGWIMVASGLVDEPRVAPIKLALHLSLAFVFFLALLWTYWQVRGDHRHHSSLYTVSRWLFALIFAQVIFGALVAGLDAGLSYNTYPLMDGSFIPEGLHRIEPWWKNHVESVLTVQFQHRMAALALVAACLGFAMAAWKRATHAQRHTVIWLISALKLQFALGVLTLLTGVHMWLAVAHQLGALLLIAVALRITYQFGRD